MSLSYTGEASMDEPALRDVERWKDKVEVRLDNRQVFFLFFGSALCACMLFVLGVIVGKRLESRGRAAAPEVQDPLAVLDRINSVGLASAGAASKTAEPALTFQKALIGAPAKLPTTSPPPRSPVASAAKPAPAAARVPAVAKVSSAPALVPAPVKASAPPAGKLPAVSISRAAPAAPAPPKPPAAVPAPPAPPRGRFTLQLSSFADRGEADALARRYSAQGAYVVATEVPGKGTWYRVRVGSYGSSQEAIAAKGSFEKQTNTIAYIAGR
ncbi:MAG TPA: SPOR domain-containing protein [Polyangia bacterium]|jgi:septal ring-binding cell division protein DamX|nr:SPOR domain-containing protein [Polyangia bacterium]